MSLLTNLAVYYSMDESSGSRADSVGGSSLSEYPGTINGASGKISNAAHFVADGYQFYLVGLNIFSNDQAFTVSGWYYFDADGATHTLADYSSGFNLIRYSDNYIYASMRASSNTSIGSAAAVTISTWYHVVMTHDPVGNTVNLILNDGTPQSTSHTAGTNGGANQLNFGDSGYSMRALVDEFGIWTRVLTSGEITQLYNGGAGLAYSSFGGGGGGTTARRLMLMGVGA